MTLYGPPKYCGAGHFRPAWYFQRRRPVRTTLEYLRGLVPVFLQATELLRLVHNSFRLDDNDQVKSPQSSSVSENLCPGQNSELLTFSPTCNLGCSV